MRPEQVIVTISETGEIQVEAAGIVGKGCEALTKPFEQGLGVRTGDKKKPEFLQQAPAAQQQRAGQ